MRSRSRSNASVGFSPAGWNGAMKIPKRKRSDMGTLLGDGRGLVVTVVPTRRRDIRELVGRSATGAAGASVVVVGGGGLDLADEVVGQDLVVIVRGNEAPATSGQRTQVERVTDDLGGGNEGRNLLLAVLTGRRADDAPAACRQVGQHVALVARRDGDLQHRDRLQDDRSGSTEGFFETGRSGVLERHVRRIDAVVLAV